MKRLLLAIAIGLFVVTTYMIVSSLIFVQSGQNLAIVPYLDLPVKLPKIVFYYFSPPIAEDFSPEPTQRKLLIGLFAYIANILLYSILAYILLTIFRRRRTKDELKQTQPPAPPSFAN
jgi:ABC-type Na+ efflux pump permease subunit